MWSSRQPERWSDRHSLLARLVGVTVGVMVGGVAAAALLLYNAPSPEHPEPDAVMVAPPTHDVDPELVLNVEHCQKVAETLGDIGRVVTASGSVLDDAVLEELDHAENRMTRREGVPSPSLAATFDDIHASLDELRRAIRTDTGVEAALDDTLELINTVDDQCHDVIAGAEVSDRTEHS